MLKYCCILFFLLTSLYSQPEYRVDSHVASATVYRDHALITRECEVTLSKGISTVILSNLPVDLRDESIRAVARGEGDVRILELKISTITTNDIQQNKVKKLNAKLDSLAEAISSCEDKAAVIDYQRGVLESIHAESPKIVFNKQSVDVAAPGDWGTSLDFVENNLQRVIRSADSVRKIIKEIEKQKAVEKQNLAILQSSQTKQFKEITLVVETADKGITHITAAYLTRATRWYPVYDAHVYPSDSKTEFSYYGMVQQSTGEDWSDIYLALSTANPTNNLQIPKQKTWLIGIADNQGQFRGGRNADASGFTAPDVHKTDLSTTFYINEKISIPSDNSNHQITIATKVVPTILKYSSIPKLSTGVFLQGYLVNTFDFPILSGELSVFVDNDFIKKTGCENTIQNDTLVVTLGPDDKLQAEKKLIYRKIESAGLFGGSRRADYAFEIQLVNNRTVPVELDLQDQIPIASSDDITIKLLEPDIPFEKLGSDRKLSWKITLQPGERKVIPIKYSVTAPKQVTVYGME